nr:ABC-2 transporter permease [uncultured Caproiciproducens sp.]
MLGLLVKDLLYLKKQLKLIFLIIAFYAIILAATGSGIEQFNAIFVTLIPMLPMIVITNSFAYDELSKWNAYSLSLPVTKKEIVLCKYLLTMILTFGTALIPFVATIVFGKLTEGSFAGIYAAFGVALILCAILIPLFYQFGTQKARIALITIVMIPWLGAFLLKQARFSGPSNAQISFLLKISPIFLIIFFIGSYFLSCKILRNKEI